MQMPKKLIRLAEEPDLSDIRRIVDESYSHYIERIGCRPAPMSDDYARLIEEHSVWVFTVDERLIGLIVQQLKHDHVLVSNVAVGKAFQGQGYGRELLHYAENFAREKGKRELRLYTNELMQENLRIYSKLGWKEYERTEEDGFRRVFMRKTLR